MTSFQLYRMRSRCYGMANIRVMLESHFASTYPPISHLAVNWFHNIVNHWKVGIDYISPYRFLNSIIVLAK